MINPKSEPKKSNPSSRMPALTLRSSIGVFIKIYAKPNDCQKLQ